MSHGALNIEDKMISESMKAIPSVIVIKTCEMRDALNQEQLMPQ
jgi:hypothetical protein